MNTIHPEQPRPVMVRFDGTTLTGDWSRPRDAAALIAFAHGSGSSRQSPRNRRVAAQLNEAGLATLLIDLLTSDEEAADRRSGELRFDVAMLGRRMVRIVDWLARSDDTRGLPIGLFGASTGAGAALAAAATRPEYVKAVVSRGGRPDLAADWLPRVHAPTLLLVGGADEAVIDYNQQALERFPPATVARMSIIPHAGHLFEEPGTLDEVARESAAWFQRHLLAHRIGDVGFEELDPR